MSKKNSTEEASKYDKQILIEYIKSHKEYSNEVRVSEIFFEKFGKKEKMRRI